MPAELKPLIFLDVDGCINRWASPPRLLLAEQECMDHLNAILDATFANIVVTSSLRGLVHSGEMSLHGLEHLLRSHGMHGRVVGITAPTDDDDESDCRGRQILAYRDRSTVRPRYVVIDDDDDGISARGLPFVHVNGSIGLTAADAEKAIQLLGASP